MLRHDLGFGAPTIARIVPAVRERLTDVPQPLPLPPDEERLRLFDAVSQFLLALGARAPVVLILDDLQWAETSSIALLRHIARFASQQRLLIVGAYRGHEIDDFHPLATLLAALRRETSYERLVLQGLSPSDTAALSTAAAGQQIAEAVLRSISTYTEGNPFFVREVVETLLETGRLGEERAIDMGELGASEGIRYLLCRRMSRVSPDAQQFLTVAAACGGPFRIEVPATVLGYDDTHALAALDEALRADVSVSFDGADTYDFRHALLRDALYSPSPPSRRIRLHRQIADAMERVYGEQAPEHAAEIAGQYLRSKTLPGADRGATHAIRAADSAVATHAHAECARFLRVALELLPSEDPQRATLLARLGLSLTWSLQLDEALAVARDAALALASRDGGSVAGEYLAEAACAMSTAGSTTGAWALATDGLGYIGARRDAAWVSLTLFDMLRQAAEDPDGLGIPPDSEARRELCRVAEGIDLPMDRRWLLVGHGICSFFESRAELIARAGDDPTLGTFWLGDFVRCRALWKRAAAQCEREGKIATAIECWAQLARVLTALGELPAAAKAYQQGVVLAGRCATQSRQVLQLLGARFEMLMAIDEGWKEFARQQRDTPTTLLPENRFGITAMQAAAACAAARMRRVDDALMLVDALLPALERAPAWLGNCSQIACDAAEVLWLTERDVHADRIEAVVRDKVIQPDFRYPMRDGRLALARLLALQGRYDDATKWFADAREVLAEQHARPLRAIVDHDEGLAFLRRRDGRSARPLLEAALESFRALGMTGWIARAEDLLVASKPGSPPAARAAMTPVQQSQPALPPLRDVGAPATEPGEPRAATNQWRKEGDYWTIAYDGRTVRLKDAKGLFYISCLIRAPTRDFHVAELTALGAGELGGRERNSSIAVGRDAGPMLDSQATSAYRERLRDLREELESATAAGDLGRAARAREESELLTQQLTTAYGLGGRARRAADPTERMRKAVTNRIRRAITIVAAAHPALGRHLQNALRTGFFCSYTPDHPVPWDF